MEIIMSLAEEFHKYAVNNTPVESEKKIVFEMLKKLTDRMGFDQSWAACDDDIQVEIIEEMLEIQKHE